MAESADPLDKQYNPSHDAPPGSGTGRVSAKPEIDVSVSVTLGKDMEFTAVYPIVPVRKLRPQGKKIQWDVHTGADGTLVERETGLQLSSLFWEADLNARSPLLVNSSGDSISGYRTWTLSDSDSVVLPIENITDYLEKALLSLGLHTEARTSFITFWLPSFLSHKYIALRFMPQADYSRIAPLSISPEPDVVTRVFMLFQGVRNLVAWPVAQLRALDDVSHWAHVVGVNTADAFNMDLSRVLEWGAMEIPS
ncbi:hypothetical protein H0H87_008564 [Tephrocybe sp. NHM501043]|nr:hypothetical protein H0H87_008564 [Tephrocybe sp. NHM501043]